MLHGECDRGLESPSLSRAQNMTRPRTTMHQPRTSANQLLHQSLHSTALYHGMGHIARAQQSSHLCYTEKARVYPVGVWFGFVGFALLVAFILCWVGRCFGSWVLLGLFCLFRVTWRKLQTPGNAEEHKRQETPTINPIGPTDKPHRLSTKHCQKDGLGDA